MSKSNIEKFTYEESIKELENILHDLENEENTLEDSLKKFEYGLELYNHCNKILTKTENKIRILLNEENDQEENFK